MMRVLFFIGFVFLFWSACDTAPPTVSPKIRVTFKDLPKNIKIKQGDAWKVLLKVQSQSTKDYSPPAQEVALDAQYADFEVMLPPDSTYSFTASYFLNDELRAEGSTRTLVALSTESITIPVTVFPPNDFPFVGVIPTLNRISKTETPILHLNLKVYNPPLGLQSGLLRFDIYLAGIPKEAITVKNGKLAQEGTRLIYFQELKLQNQGFVIDVLSIDLRKATENRVSIMGNQASFSNTTVPWYPTNAFDALIDILP